ncbi:MAG: methyl-accepting chemotaxis protein [Lachnospiraceae bacterium]|nr:methyl-accepting chemotaxis protein [Lachnospiraceae bacterium]
MRTVLMMFALVPMLILSGSLSAFSITRSSRELKESACNSMVSMVREIGSAFDYTVESNERILCAYSTSPLVKDIMISPLLGVENGRAQNYTTDFYSKVSGWEGLYISSWETQVLAHSNPDAIGMVLREGDSLTKLQDNILACDGTYNAGILKSPSSGQLVMSLYVPVFDDDGSPLGFVGGAMSVHDIAEHYSDVSSLGLSSAYMYFVDPTGTLLYHKDEAKVGQPVENTAIKALVDQIAAGTHPEPACVEYKENGKTQLAGYFVAADNSYIAVIAADEDDVLSSVQETTKVSLILLIAGILASAVLTILIAFHVAKPLMKITTAIEQISRGDVTARCDANSVIRETAGITEAFHSLKEALNTSMINVKDSANALNGAIINVDGKTTNNVEQVSRINDAISDVSQTSQVVADDAQVIAAKSMELGENIEILTDNVTTLFDASQTIKSANDEATDCMQSVYANGNESVIAIRNISDKIAETNEAISKIGTAVQAIESIAAQTNLLSLNASIEAARAGEAGKGFAVVADEIRSLADSSAESAREIKQVIEDVIALSNGTVEISGKVYEVITREQEDIEEAQAKFTVLSESVEASIREIGRIKEMTGRLDTIKDELSKTTSELGAISEELGASAQEVSASCQLVTTACTDTQQSAIEMRNINENMSQAIDFFKL